MDEIKLNSMRRSFNILEERKKKLLEDESECINELRENVKEIRK